MAQAPTPRAKSGFHGAIGSTPLVDLLQVWSMNRFAGLVAVTSQGRSGQLYFVDGEIVHAEAEGRAGEDAVRAIVGWPEGGFELFPNTTTIHRTIQKSISHLLLDAHRALDEEHRAVPPPVPPRAPAPRPPGDAAPRPNPLDEIRALPGVTLLVACGSDGRVAGRGGPDTEQLAAKATYLAVAHAAPVASAFGLRELSTAALQSPGEVFGLVHASGRYLCVAVEAGASADAVLAQVRAILGRPAGRQP